MSVPVPDLTPGEVSVRLMGGLRVLQAVYVVAERGVATILEQEGRTTVAALAERTATHPVRSLAPLGAHRREGAGLPPRSVRRCRRAPAVAARHRPNVDGNLSSHLWTLAARLRNVPSRR